MGTLDRNANRSPASTLETALDLSTPMLSVDDVATKCNVTVGTVRKWRQNGVGPKWRRLGKHRRCEPAYFIAWLEQCAADDAAARSKAADEFDDGWD
jgi:hypothetical protein